MIMIGLWFGKLLTPTPCAENIAFISSNIYKEFVVIIKNIIILVL